MSFFSPQGRFLARAVGEEQGNVLLRQTQYRIADSEAESCLYARNFILGKVYNARWVLERATRDHPQRVPVEQLKRTSAQLAAALPLIEQCDDLDQLRGLEGEAAQRYFDCFDSLILQQHDDFAFICFKYGRKNSANCRLLNNSREAIGSDSINLIPNL